MVTDGPDLPGDLLFLRSSLYHYYYHCWSESDGPDLLFIGCILLIIIIIIIFIIIIIIIIIAEVRVLGQIYYLKDAFFSLSLFLSLSLSLSLLNWGWWASTAGDLLFVCSSHYPYHYHCWSEGDGPVLPGDLLFVCFSLYLYYYHCWSESDGPDLPGDLLFCWMHSSHYLSWWEMISCLVFNSVPINSAQQLWWAEVRSWAR